MEFRGEYLYLFGRWFPQDAEGVASQEPSEKSVRVYATQGRGNNDLDTGNFKGLEGIFVSKLPFAEGRLRCFDQLLHTEKAIEDFKKEYHGEFFFFNENRKRF